MKRLLVVLSLALCSCDLSHTYTNVDYKFDYTRLQYIVITRDYQTFNVDPSRFYAIKVESLLPYKETDINGEITYDGFVENRFYSNTMELFVYYTE